MALVIRTWNRNGDRNFMDEEAALENLAKNAEGYPLDASYKHKRADVHRRLHDGEIVHTRLAFFRLAAALLAMLLCPFAAFGQFAEWHWAQIDATEYALWHNGVQVGNYRLTDESYYPRLAPGRWGDACDCPCHIAPQIVMAQQQYRKDHWKTRGVLTAPPRTKRSTGLRYRNLPGAKPPQGELPDESKKRAKCDCPDCPPDCNCGCAPVLQSRRLSDDIEKIPDYSAMPSLTLVARNEADAKAALEMYEQAPELASWREKYGPRVKAYGLQEFQHTGAAFKLDQDRQFQESGFVALVQPQAPDAEGKAAVRSYYAWATPQQALKALRDADPAYDPNPASPARPSVDPSDTSALWGKLIAGTGLGGGSVVMFLGAVAAALRSILR